MRRSGLTFADSDTETNRAGPDTSGFAAGRARLNGRSPGANPRQVRTRLGRLWGRSRCGGGATGATPCSPPDRRRSGSRSSGTQVFGRQVRACRWQRFGRQVFGSQVAGAQVFGCAGGRSAGLHLAAGGRSASLRLAGLRTAGPDLTAALRAAGLRLTGGRTRAELGIEAAPNPSRPENVVVPDRC